MVQAFSHVGPCRVGRVGPGGPDREMGLGHETPPMHYIVLGSRCSGSNYAKHGLLSVIPSPCCAALNLILWQSPEFQLRWGSSSLLLLATLLYLLSTTR